MAKALVQEAGILHSAPGSATGSLGDHVPVTTG